MDNTAAARRHRFEALAAHVYEPVQRYVRRRVDAHSTDDVVSDTMLTLWRRLDDVPPQAELPWAYGVARRHIANHHRSSRRHLSLVSRAQAQRPLPAETDHPLDLELHAALATLSKPDRELLHLWAWEGLEPADIGVVLGLTSNAVSIRLHRAKKKLGRNLETMRKEAVASGHSHRESRKRDRS